MVVVWSKPAQDDLKKYLKNSKLVTEEKSQKYIERLIDYANSLENFPNLGKDFYMYKNLAIKQLLFDMHRIFYVIKNEKIIIIQVSHYARSIDNIMKSLKKYMKDY